MTQHIEVTKLDQSIHEEGFLWCSQKDKSYFQVLANIKAPITQLKSASYILQHTSNKILQSPVLLLIHMISLSPPSLSPFTRLLKFLCILPPHQFSAS